jgi:signal transduction histidine kinase
VTRVSDLPGAEADYLRPHLVAMARAMLVGVVASGALACCSWLVTLGYRPPERGFFMRAIAASASAWTLALPLLYALVRHPIRQQRRAQTLLGRVAAARALMAAPRRMAGVLVAVHAAVFTGAACADWGHAQAHLLLFFGVATAAPSALAVWISGQAAAVRALHMRAPLGGDQAPELRTRLALELAAWAGLALAPILPTSAVLLTLTDVALTPRLLLLGLLAPAAAALFYRYGRALERDMDVARVRVMRMQDGPSPLVTPVVTSPVVETSEGLRIVGGIASLVETHRRQLGEERDARTSITESQRLKTRFMAYMSHDLRSPLNAILGFTDLLVTGSDPLNPEQRESLDTVRHAADDLLRLVTQVLDTARLEAGKLKLVSGYVPVATLISAVMGGARRTTETLGVELDTRVEPGVPPCSWTRPACSRRCWGWSCTWPTRPRQGAPSRCVPVAPRGRPVPRLRCGSSWTPPAWTPPATRTSSSRPSASTGASPGCMQEDSASGCHWHARSSKRRGARSGSRPPARSAWPSRARVIDGGRPAIVPRAACPAAMAFDSGHSQT